ncbi:unnamed protein product [Caenorhabditis angaria]|uniref:RRM domain-containing protein n=1 Tax=Caenorhabditis angaria TaxID=860376 RepID=A0A9P1I612_9PELO|nr:unnamed protein product [Caenorhabditis angaria]
MSVPDFQSKWVFVISVQELDDSKREELKEFSTWFMQTFKKEGALSGHIFNYDDSPIATFETEVNNFDSCTDVYQKIQNNHPQVVLVVHILPQVQSSEYEWMKILAQRYGLMRQGILYENAVKRFEGLDLSASNIFRKMCQWNYRSSLAMLRGEGNACGLLIGKSNTPTLEKVLYNTDDIRIAVNKVLHKEEEPKGNESENYIRVCGYPEMLNSFGIAQILAPFRVLDISQIKANEAIVLVENKFQAYQACRDLNGKVLSRNNTLKVSPLGTNVTTKLTNL